MLQTRKAPNPSAPRPSLAPLDGRVVLHLGRGRGVQHDEQRLAPRRIPDPRQCVAVGLAVGIVGDAGRVALLVVAAASGSLEDDPRRVQFAARDRCRRRPPGPAGRPGDIAVVGVRGDHRGRDCRCADAPRPRACSGPAAGRQAPPRAGGSSASMRRCSGSASMRSSVTASSMSKGPTRAGAAHDMAETAQRLAEVARDGADIAALAADHLELGVVGIGARDQRQALDEERARVDLHRLAFAGERRRRARRRSSRPRTAAAPA